MSYLLSAIGADALLNAMPDSTAVLDSTGVIVAVNNAWRMFGRDNEAPPEGTGVGVDYLEVCARSAVAGCADAEEVGVALRAVLHGETVESVVDYACPSTAFGRWFALRATPIAGSTPGVLVSHTNITRQKVAELDLERQASHDPLTGLANRARFTRRLESALTPRQGRMPRADVGLVYLDLDGFKPVNDTFGHAAGDEVLQNVAGRLAAVVRPQDTVARLGGDEFAVVAPRITAAGLARLASRIDDALREPYVVHGLAVTVAASVGACRAVPGECAAEAVHRADKAMYVVKRARQAGGRPRETAPWAAPADSPTT